MQWHWMERLAWNSAPTVVGEALSVVLIKVSPVLLVTTLRNLGLALLLASRGNRSQL